MDVDRESICFSYILEGILENRCWEGLINGSGSFSCYWCYGNRGVGRDEKDIV
jgi:hypothetical protein